MLVMPNFIARGIVLLALVNVSISTPTVTLNGTFLLNHSLVFFSEIGNRDDGSDSLQCHTKLDTGVWFFPNGTSLPVSSHHSIYQQNNSSNRVDLRLSRDSVNPRSGMYYCKDYRSGIIYVGLNASDEGHLSIKTIFASKPHHPWKLFNLTCVSIGGPATTVIWTRYSLPLTEGTKSVLVNSTTAEYNHTLTSSFGGDYECRVYNRISYQAKDFNLTNAQVVTLSVVNVSSTSALVSWTSAGNYVWYNLTWRRNTSFHCPSTQQNNSINYLDSSRLKYALKGLEQNSVYNIMLVAWNSISSITDSTSLATKVAKPSQAPNSVAATTISPVSITVSWNPIDCIHENGPLTGYSIIYKRAKQRKYYKGIVSSTNRTTIISRLSPYTVYSIKVAVMNSAGIGVYSDPIVIRTQRIVINTTVGYTFIMLTWENIETVNNTTIDYSNTNNTDCFKTTKHYSTSQNLYNLTGLEEGTQYNITLTTFFSDGYTVNQMVLVTTSIRAPTGSPRSVTAMVNSSTSYVIEWDPVDCRDRNGHIISYLLKYSTAEGEYRNQINITNGLRHRIENLNITTVYTVQISAINAAGLGVLSKALTFQTPENIFLSLNGKIIPNNSFINISRIGLTHLTALICHNKIQERLGGDWFGPDGTGVGGWGQFFVPGFRRNRAYMVVRLLRRHIGIPPEGMYRCEFTTSDGRLHTLVAILFETVTGNIIVSRDVTFTKISSPTEPNKLFRVTCISMGGIPANVTWMRNGSVISINSPKLVDIDSQTYNYSLEVYGRYEGVYTCFVSGLYNRDSANITVKAPATPTGINVVQIGFNSARVSWVPGGEMVTGYLISYSLRGITQRETKINVSAITLSKLVMGETYSIFIIATSSTLYSYPANTTAYIDLSTISMSHIPSFPVAGDQVNLTCFLSLPKALQHTNPILVWEYKGRSLNSVKSRVHSSQVEVNKISTTQAGKYSCNAILNGHLVNYITLIVAIPVPTPSVVINSNSPVIMAGSSLTLYCNYSLSEYVIIDGVNITITWKVNNTVINRPSELILNDSIILSPVTTADSGRYTCCLDITSKTDYTTVQSPRQSAGNPLIIQIPQPDVTIIKEPSEVIYPGTNITLTCSIGLPGVVNNNETISARWLLPHIMGNSRYSIIPLKKQSINIYIGQLIINPIIEQDAGNIACVGIVNGGTFAQNTAIISILPQESIVILEEQTESDTRTITITWKMNRNVLATHLNISYSNLETSCLNDWGSFTLPHAQSGNLTLTDLEEYTKYSISILVLKTYYLVGEATTSVETEADVPSAAPSEFNVTEVTSSSVKLLWKPVICIHQNGIITGYIIHYREYDNGTNDTIDIPGENTTEVDINDIKSSTRYEISIAAVNTKGTGKYTTREVITNSVEDIDTVGWAVAGVVIGLTLITLILICLWVLLRKQLNCSISKVKVKEVTSPQTLSNYYVCDNEDFIDESPKKGIEMKPLSSVFNLSNDDWNSDISMEQFPEYVKYLHENKDDILKKQYTALEGMTLPLSEIAQLRSNSKHNRFKNILPYDYNRVILNQDEEDGSDYINASLIYGDKDGTKCFIAAQGPTEATVERFLEMIWLYNVPTIVMLTRCIEDGRTKCEQYWPDQLETTLTVEKYNVTVKSYVPLAEYHIRKLQLTKIDEADKEMCVTHMLYTAWPDHGVPHNAMSLISFIRRVRREHPASLSQPLLVHCSAGVGRTGTFILLDLAIQQMMNKGTISVLSQLKELMKQRMKPIQTQANYNFVHDALRELVFCGETEISAADIMTAIAQLHRQVPSGMTDLEKQFQKLVQLSFQNSDVCEEAKKVCNKGKNRLPDIVPNEYHRVRLDYDGEEGSDYINASFVDGYKLSDAYIATQGPMANTVNDFWRMVWEHNCSCIVMLCGLFEQGQESCCRFWPQETSVYIQAEVYGKLKVTLKSTTPHEDITLRKLVVEESEGKSLNYKIITLLQLNSWPLSELPHPISILTLIDLLGVAQRSCTGKHTIIMCSDGIGRTGTFICIHSQLERLKTEGVVDFFQGTKSARIQRAGLVPNSVHYAFCHNVVVTYLDSLDSYANFKILDS